MDVNIEHWLIRYSADSVMDIRTDAFLFFDLFEKACFVFEDIEQTFDLDQARKTWCFLARLLDNEDYEPTLVLIGDLRVHMKYEVWVMLYRHLDAFLDKFFYEAH